MTPLGIAYYCNHSAAIISLLIDTTAALASRDYGALATLVHCSAPILCRLSLSPARLLTRTSILICLKRLTPQRASQARRFS